MNPVRIGEVGIPVTSTRLVELVNEYRRLRERPLLPDDMDPDNMRISWNSEEYRDDLINITFLGHLQYDVLIPYPSNAWMGSVLPDETFDEVHSINYYQKINGDCELTHAMEDLYRILQPGGTAYIGVPNFKLILDKVVRAHSDTESLKWEHFLFSRNVDERGLFYNQSVCDFKRIRNRALYAGFKSVDEDKICGEEYEKYLTMEPDEYNLPNVDNIARKKFWVMIRDDSIRRKRCIIPRCNAKAGQKEFRRERSVYCRRHYRKAKQKLEEAQERALRAIYVLKKG